jgi:hypothetical protein
MLASTLHTKWVTRLFVLIYLLLSFSTANAFYWCKEEASSSHLETNPIGQCWTDCSSNATAFQQNLETTQTEAFSPVPGAGCLDSPVSASLLTSSNRMSPLNRLFATPFYSVNFLHNPALGLGEKRFVN